MKLTPVNTRDHQQNSAASPLRLPPAQRLRQDQQGRASLVVDTQHYAVEADDASEKYLRGRHRVCIHSVRATCCVVSTGSPVSVATEQKTLKNDWNKKPNSSFMSRKM